MPDALPPDSPQPEVAGAPAPSPCPYLDPEHAPLPKSGPFRKWPWITVLMPFAVYMLFQTMFESRLADPPGYKPGGDKIEAAAPATDPQKENAAEAKLRHEREAKEAEEKAHKIPYEQYPVWYTRKIAFTTLAILIVIPGYRYFPWRISGLSVLVGVVGAVAWIGICKIHLEPKILGPIGLGGLIDMGRRPGFNPLEQLKDNPQWAYGFLAIRFFGLVVVVSIVEEFFLRGFLMRYVMDVDWPLIPFAVVNRLALIVGTAFPMLMHPGELIASAVWFSMVTWLMLRTKSIGDTITAHAITNLLIGLWVLYSGDWWLM